MIMSKAYPCVYFNNGKCKKFSDEKYTSWCTEGICGAETPSNADRIRAMSDEELAENLCDKRLTKEMWLKWLKQPAEET